MFPVYTHQFLIMYCVPKRGMSYVLFVTFTKDFFFCCTNV